MRLYFLYFSKLFDIAELRDSRYSYNLLRYLVGIILPEIISVSGFINFAVKIRKYFEIIKAGYFEFYDRNPFQKCTVSFQYLKDDLA